MPDGPPTASDPRKRLNEPRRATSLRPYQAGGVAGALLGVVAAAGIHLLLHPATRCCARPLSVGADESET